MAKKRLKFIKKSGKKDEFLEIVERMKTGDLDGLDIKPLVGKTGFYRCRLGSVRIIFSRIDGKIEIHSIGSRGDIYNSI